MVDNAMALNIKNAQVEALASEIAALTGESKTEAVRRALLERKDRLALRVVSLDASGSFQRFLEEEFWPQLPPSELGRRLSKREREKILGYGSEGV
jgi:antitoxin VapB